jgi:PhnB protein
MADFRQPLQAHRLLSAGIRRDREVRLDGPDDEVGHAELRIGDTRLMLSEPCPQGTLGSLPPFYGDRTGSLTDPFGHLWFVATHIEDLTPEQIKTRAQEIFHQLKV